jgi:hypothetical protein
MFLWFYSMLDLVSQPFDPRRFLDTVSVCGFMSSRWYATDASAKFHEHILTKAFSVPTYLTSAAAYRNFLDFTVRTPDPMLWVLKTDSYEGIFGPLESKLRILDCDIRLGQRVVKISVNSDRIEHIYTKPSDMFGDLREKDDGESLEDEDIDEETTPLALTASRKDFDFVILAVPPKALSNLIEPFRDKVGSISGTRKLQSGVTACLDLCFNRLLDDIPSVHVVLRDSRLGLTFFDNSQTWKKGTNTCLSVAATNYSLLEGMTKENAKEAIIQELQRYIPFDRKRDIDSARSYLQMNTNEPLFINEVGSEAFRPQAQTEIKNLFLAGDFCDNPVNIVTVEGAVISGLQAAQAVQAVTRADPAFKTAPNRRELLRKIEILEPETYPSVNFKAVKLALGPYAAGAKVWSRLEQMSQSPSGNLSARDIRAIGMELLTLPGAYAVDWWDFALDAANWMADLATPED